MKHDSINYIIKAGLVATAVLFGGLVIQDCNESAIKRIAQRPSKVEKLFLDGHIKQAKQEANEVLSQVGNYRPAGRFPEPGVDTNILNEIEGDCKRILSNHYAGVYNPSIYLPGTSLDPNRSTTSGNTVSRTNGIR